MYVSPQSLPRTIEIGVSTTLTLDVYPEDSATLTAASAATVTVYQGQAVLVNAAVATVGGAYTASYALSGSVTTGLTPSDDYLEVWSITVSGAVHTFQRAGYLVRRAFHPSVTDAALTDYHSDLANLRPSTLTTYEPYRRRAGDWIQRRLLEQGRRPWLVFDAWALEVPHVYKALSLIFTDFESSIGDGRYAKLAASYEARAEAEFAKVQFRYDLAETGTIRESDGQSGVATPLFLTSGPNTRAWSRYGR